MKYDIFVSYRRTNRELVAQIVRRLEQSGVSAWYDAEIEGGADWRETIVEALTNSSMLVIFFCEECNASRQLKKELAVADSLNKAVVPILIEDVQPKGAYLYELADRNWIQAWPNPEAKIDELVNHLVALSGKGAGMLASQRPPASLAADAPAARAAAPIDPAHASAPAVGGAASSPTPADIARVEPAPAAAAAHSPNLADAYVGRVGAQARKPPSQARDILPFNWLDLVPLVPMVGGLAWWLKTDKVFVDAKIAMFEPLSIGLICLALVGLYGAVVFPVRYYLRRRPLGVALMNYLISSLILYATLLGGFTLAWSRGIFPNDQPLNVAVFFGLIWVAFTVLAFIIYGLLATQRALRSFRSNIKKI